MPPHLIGWIRSRLSTNPPDSAPETQPDDVLSEQARELVEQYVADWQASMAPAWDLRPSDYPSGRLILEAEPRLQIACIHAALPRLMQSPQLARIGDRYVAPHLTALQPLVRQLFLRRLPYTPSDLERILGLLADRPTTWAGYVPLPSVLKHVERQVAEAGLTTGMRQGLERLHKAGARQASSDSERKALALIERLLGLRREEGAGIDRRDDWGRAAGESLDQLEGDVRAAWMAILEHAGSAEATRPPKVWLEEARRRIAVVGRERFKMQAIDWLGYLSLPSGNSKYVDGDNQYRDANGEVPGAVITAANAQLLKD